MKNNWLNIVLKGMCAFLLVATSLHAEETAETRTEVAESTLTYEEEQKLQEEYAAPDEEIEEVEYAGEDVTATGEESIEAAGCLTCKSYQGMFLNPKTISEQGDLVEMKDGSTWLIHEDDALKTKTWQPDVEKIMPSQYGGAYRYRLNVISNGNIRDSVRAKLRLGPYVGGHFRPLQIKSINSSTKEIKLSDGSRWSITSWDNYIYYDMVPGDMKQRHWAENDVMFVGYNSDWMNSWINGYRRPYILINVNLDKIVRAQFIGY